MLHFTFLGTSSGVPTLTRNVSALAIRNSKNKDWILVDAGEGTQHRIQQAKLSFQNEPYRVCRRPLFLRECPDEKSKIHP